MAENDGGTNGDAGGSGTVARPAWLDSAPDAYKNNEAFYGFTEPAKFYEKADALLKAEKSMVVVPGEKATDAERAAFYTKLGRPETADKYTIAKPEGLPEIFKYDPAIEVAFKKHSHESGKSNAQTKADWEWYWNTAKEGAIKQQQAEAQANEMAINQLKDEWKGDEFKVNTELAARSFKKFGGDKPEVVKFIEETEVNGLPLGNHPMFLRVFAAIGKAIADDSLSAGGRGGSGGVLSDEDKAKARFPNTYKK